MVKIIYCYKHRSKKRSKIFLEKKHFCWRIMQFLEWLDTVESKRNYLLSKPNYNNTKSFTENLFAIEIEKTQILFNKSIYIRLSKLELSTIVMQEFWYDYVKPKYGEKAKLYIIWINTVSLYTWKRMMFIKKFQMMLKLDLILQTMNY